MGGYFRAADVVMHVADGCLRFAGGAQFQIAVERESCRCIVFGKPAGHRGERRGLRQQGAQGDIAQRGQQGFHEFVGARVRTGIHRQPAVDRVEPGPGGAPLRKGLGQQLFGDAVDQVAHLLAANLAALFGFDDGGALLSGLADHRHGQQFLLDTQRQQPLAIHCVDKSAFLAGGNPAAAGHFETAAAGEGTLGETGLEIGQIKSETRRQSVQAKIAKPHG